MLGWNLDAYMHVLGHNMALQNPTFLLTGSLMKDGAELSVNAPKQRLSALRKWLQRFAHEGLQGLMDRPRPGRPRKVTDTVSTCILHLVDQDPMAHGALSSQWNCRKLGTAVTRHTDVALHSDTIRGVLKKGA